MGRPFVGFERVRSLAPCRRLAGFTNRDEGADRGLASVEVRLVSELAVMPTAGQTNFSFSTVFAIQ